MKSIFAKGSIGYTMEVAEQEGKDAWLCGFKMDECPYDADKQLIACVCWKTGWTVVMLADEKLSFKLETLLTK